MDKYCYYVYWIYNGEPMREEFDSLPAAEEFSCKIRGCKGVEDVEISKEKVISREELEKMFPDEDFTDYGEWRPF